MKHFSLENLAQGIRDKHVGAERARLTEKWSRTGLLRGLDGTKREVMAQLLENQAAQVLKESNSMSTGGGNLAGSGQITGFSNIAFPIVRRVFGGLVANELVSIQPMSLPSGLIFYLDYTYGSNVGSTDGGTTSTYTRGQSLYNNPTGKGIQSGSLASGGMYDLVNTGYSRVTGSATGLTFAAVGAWGGTDGNTWSSGLELANADMLSGSNARFADFDGQVENDLDLGNLDASFAIISLASFTNMDKLAANQLAVFAGVTNATAWGETYQGGTGVLNLRRLNKRGNWNGSVFTPDALNGTHIITLVKGANGAALAVDAAAGKVTFSVSSALSVDGGTGSTVTIPSFESDFGTNPTPAIPEIDIKIEAISITAETRKLRANGAQSLHRISMHTTPWMRKSNSQAFSQRTLLSRSTARFLTTSFHRPTAQITTGAAAQAASSTKSQELIRILTARCKLVHSSPAPSVNGTKHSSRQSSMQLTPFTVRLSAVLLTSWSPAQMFAQSSRLRFSTSLSSRSTAKDKSVRHSPSVQRRSARFLTASRSTRILISHETRFSSATKAVPTWKQVMYMLRTYR
jgi:hypothetical protein